MTVPPDGEKPDVTIELGRQQAAAMTTALFMCLRPTNLHPPFRPVIDLPCAERGYAMLLARMGGEGDLAGAASTPDHPAAAEEHQARFTRYAEKVYSTPSWMAGPADGSDEDGTGTSVAVRLTPGEAAAVATALFVCLQPSTAHAPFHAALVPDDMERGYQAIAATLCDLDGRWCARCGTPWAVGMRPWDAVADPETGEMDIVCERCLTADEQANRRDHHVRFGDYVRKHYPVSFGPPAGD